MSAQLQTRRFTGNPFIDAGIAGTCAAANVGTPTELTPDKIKQAVEKLLSIITSESAFKRTKEGAKGKSFATSTMARIFPNSPLPQGSYSTQEEKTEKYRERIEEYLGELTTAESPIDQQCFACGAPALLHVGIDRFPLLSSESQLNFHPMLQAGSPLCGFCALAVQFLPLALLQTKAEGGFLWFLHTWHSPLAVAVARELGLNHLNALVATGEPLRFYGEWACGGENGATVSLLAMLAEKYAEQLESCNSPVAAYVFSNDNRGQSLQQIPIPNELLEFFDSLRFYPQALKRFEAELLRSKLGWNVAAKMLAKESLIHLCLIDDPATLRGGWGFHRLYLKEVMNIQNVYIAAIQAIGQQLVTNEDAKKWVQALRQARQNEVFGVLLDMVRAGLLNRQQLHLLVPPNAGWAADQARDYLLGIIYCLQSGETIEPLDNQTETKSEVHPLIACIEAVGPKLLQESARPKKLIQGLREARRLDQIRHALLDLLFTGAIRWQDFVFFCPPDDVSAHYRSRDYLLAYFYDRLRNELDTTDQSATLNQEATR